MAQMRVSDNQYLGKLAKIALTSDASQQPLPVEPLAYEPLSVTFTTLFNRQKTIDGIQPKLTVLDLKTLYFSHADRQSDGNAVPPEKQILWFAVKEGTEDAEYATDWPWFQKRLGQIGAHGALPAEVLHEMQHAPLLHPPDEMKLRKLA